jgi:RNA polymerase sigma-70 factor (ECF subfamily)
VTCACTGCDCDRVGELARRHVPELAAIARAEGLTATDALDAVQQALLAVLARPDLRAAPADELAAILATVVRNAARNARRRHHHARPHVDLDDAALTDHATPHTAADTAETLARLDTCMARLGDVQRRVVALRVIEELSGPEVAAQLGLTANHVAQLLHRARAALARCMADHPPDHQPSAVAPASARSTTSTT